MSTDAITSLEYLTNIILNECPQLFESQICFECNIIHKPEPDTRCTQCNENYCMKSWCINDYDDLADLGYLTECINKDGEYEFRCDEHADSCVECGEDSTENVCYECLNKENKL